MTPDELLETTVRETAQRVIEDAAKRVEEHTPPAHTDEWMQHISELKREISRLPLATELSEDVKALLPMGTSELKRSLPASTELDELMGLAHDIQSRLDRITSRMNLYRLFQGALVGASGVIFALDFSESSLLSLKSAVFGSTICMAYTAAVEVLIMARMYRRRRAEERALSKLIDLIRETEAAYAKRQGWSTLHRARFQIQLSRFGI